jgi:hypothetical protein
MYGLIRLAAVRISVAVGIVLEWRENLPDLNKKPTVFLLYK